MTRKSFKNKIEEKDIVVEFCKYLEKNDIVFSVEVPFFNRSIDLVYIDTSNNICAIEFKLYDWKRAVKQAIKTKTAVKASFICMPEKKVTNKLIEELKREKCGLLIYCNDNTFSTLLSFSNEETYDFAEDAIKDGLAYSLENDNYGILLSI